MNDDVSKPMAAVAEYVELVIALNCGSSPTAGFTP